MAVHVLGAKDEAYVVRLKVNLDPAICADLAITITVYLGQYLCLNDTIRQLYPTCTLPFMKHPQGL